MKPFRARELELPKSIATGARGAGARRVQEWLCLNGCGVAVDGHFGPVTAAALRQFQGRRRLHRTASVTQEAFNALVRPLTLALEPLKNPPVTLGPAIVRHARAHLRQHAREVGGQNKGPWVRLYMDGNEGGDWPWCAGFVSFVTAQACESVGTGMPFARTFSCDSLATQAAEDGLLVSDRQARSDNSLLRPGSVFLVRKVPGDWVHTGIVVRVAGNNVIYTIEGNTNDEGGREGREVCARMRSITNMDFMVFDL